jgi:hypothetical protein
VYFLVRVGIQKHASGMREALGIRSRADERKPPLGVGGGLVVGVSEEKVFSIGFGREASIRGPWIWEHRIWQPAVTQVVAAAYP